MENPASPTVKSEDLAPYSFNKGSDDQVIADALNILSKRLAVPSTTIVPESVKHYCGLLISTLDHEMFGVMFLDTQNRMLGFEQMFRGTLTQASVYPREIVKAGLKYNAASVIFTHNHPSGSVAPSRADEQLTKTLKAALALVDIRVLDHVIVAGSEAFSFAECGLM